MGGPPVPSLKVMHNVKRVTRAGRADHPNSPAHDAGTRTEPVRQSLHPLTAERLTPDGRMRILAGRCEKPPRLSRPRGSASPAPSPNAVPGGGGPRRPKTETHPFKIIALPLLGSPRLDTMEVRADTWRAMPVPALVPDA